MCLAFSQFLFFLLRALVRFLVVRVVFRVVVVCAVFVCAVVRIRV